MRFSEIKQNIDEIKAVSWDYFWDVNRDQKKFIDLLSKLCEENPSNDLTDLATPASFAIVEELIPFYVWYKNTPSQNGQSKEKKPLHYFYDLLGKMILAIGEDAILYVVDEYKNNKNKSLNDKASIFENIKENREEIRKIADALIKEERVTKEIIDGLLAKMRAQLAKLGKGEINLTGGNYKIISKYISKKARHINNLEKSVHDVASVEKCVYHKSINFHEIEKKHDADSILEDYKTHLNRFNEKVSKLNFGLSQELSALAKVSIKLLPALIKENDFLDVSEESCEKLSVSELLNWIDDCEFKYDESAFIQKDLICSISMEIMREPVQASDSKLYDKDRILSWIQQCKKKGNNISSPLAQTKLDENLAFDKESYDEIKRDLLQIMQKINVDRLKKKIPLTLLIGYIEEYEVPIKIPENSEFLCSISKKIMRDPVETAEGILYERASILKHLEFSDSSPTTREFLNNKMLEPSVEAREKIRSFVLSLLEDCKRVADIDAQRQVHENVAPYERGFFKKPSVPLLEEVNKRTKHERSYYLGMGITQ